MTTRTCRPPRVGGVHLSTVGCMAKTKTTIYVCDNPPCRKRVLPVDEGRQGAEGWHLGSVTHVTRAGGRGAKGVFACSDDCVVGALNQTVSQ